MWLRTGLQACMLDRPPASALVSTRQHSTYPLFIPHAQAGDSVRQLWWWTASLETAWQRARERAWERACWCIDGQVATGNAPEPPGAAGNATVWCVAPPVFMHAMKILQTAFITDPAGYCYNTADLIQGDGRACFNAAWNSIFAMYRSNGSTLDRRRGHLQDHCHPDLHGLRATRALALGNW